MSHSVKKCKHGVVVTQCRCFNPHKDVEIVACPSQCIQREVVIEPERIFYIAICFDCTPMGEMPFETREARIGWVNIHVEATGHRVMVVPSNRHLDSVTKISYDNP